MGIDFYSVLNIPRNSSNLEIKKAYRKLALKFHPQKNPGDHESQEKFQLISEAYDVLSNFQTKAIYDQFGFEGLREGVPTAQSMGASFTEPYVYHGNPDKTFRLFFGSDNPWQEHYDRIDGDMHMSFGGLHGRGQHQKDEAIEGELHVSLEDLYFGCIKKMKISKRVMNEDGHTSSIRDKILNVVVKKGWPEGTKITFPNEGDQGPNKIPADVVFSIVDRPHPRFKRAPNGTDLILVMEITLLEALVNKVIDIQTLDDRILHIPITEIVYPNYVKVVPNEGMPKPDGQTEHDKGDLHIHFNIQFPKKLSLEQKDQLKEILN